MAPLLVLNWRICCFEKGDKLRVIDRMGILTVHYNEKDYLKALIFKLEGPNVKNGSAIFNYQWDCCIWPTGQSKFRFIKSLPYYYPNPSPNPDSGFRAQIYPLRVGSKSLSRHKRTRKKKWRCFLNKSESGPYQALRNFILMMTYCDSNLLISCCLPGAKRLPESNDES